MMVTVQRSKEKELVLPELLTFNPHILSQG